jgi:hypothetical protein
LSSHGENIVSRQAHPTPTPLTPPGGVVHYGDRIYDDPRHDPYQAKRKYEEPTVCSECGAVFHHGHWQWGTAAAGAHRAVCPACHRIHDKLPAGYLTLEGIYFDEHRDEILGLVRNEAERDRPNHPLNRIMDIASEGGRTTVTTTDVHLPQRIGSALKSAFQGELEIHYGHDEYSVRVGWRR